MASLTPGVLSKLLQNLDNSTAKITGTHRSPLLQVIGIVPQDDIFDFDNKNKSFYLRVSDSLHSAYVSVLDGDVDLILNDKIQLGQFVHVTRLDSGSPVPILRGVKPVAKRRPCVGDPKDLISSDLLLVRGKKKETSSNTCSSRRLSLSNVKIGEDVDVRRLSLDWSARKGWDRSPLPVVKHRRSGSETNGGLDIRPSSPLCPSTPVRSVKKASSVKDFVLKPPNLNLGPLKNKNAIVPEKLISKPVKKDLKTSFDSIPVSSHLTKVPISARKWHDSNISWDFVSPTIRDLGKEAISSRNLGFSSAVHALEETSAMENILQCMSVFAEICKLAESSRNPLVEQFLNFHQKLQTSTAVVNTLVNLKSTVDKTKCHPRNGAQWVQAALETNLAKFTLCTPEDSTKILHSERSYHVVLENASEKIQAENRIPENKSSPRTQEPVTSRVRRVIKKESSESVKWSKGNGLKETANLAEKLTLISRKWFLNYLEDFLNNGFGLKKGEQSGVAVGLLGQLKRVNQWLGDSVHGDEKVENLRNKLYRFLLDHVQNSAK